jgi:hypothetical protein
MVLGFNHNVRYKGELFHVQTEDSGLDNPHIVTLLYKGGVILASRKTGYADILKIENLESVVEELMKEQHKEMMRRLKSGEFDERALSAAASPFVEGGDLSVTVSLPPSFPSDPGFFRSQDNPTPSAEVPVPAPASLSAAVPLDSTGLDAAVLAFFDAHEA